MSQHPSEALSARWDESDTTESMDSALDSPRAARLSGQLSDNAAFVTPGAAAPAAAGGAAAGQDRAPPATAPAPQMPRLLSDPSSLVTAESQDSMEDYHDTPRAAGGRPGSRGGLSSRSGSLEYGHELPDGRLQPGGGGGAAAPQTAPAQLQRQQSRHARFNSYTSPRSYGSELAETPATPSTGGTFTFQPSVPRTGRMAPGQAIMGTPGFGAMSPGSSEGPGPAGGRMGMGRDASPPRSPLQLPARPGTTGQGALPSSHQPPAGMSMSAARRLSMKADRRRRSLLAGGSGLHAVVAAAQAAAAGEHSLTYAPVIDTAKVSCP